MMVFRAVKLGDLDSIVDLAAKAGIGLTTLPHDKALLKKRLQRATHAFKKDVIKPDDEYYLFVLEDSETGKIVGTSAVEASIGNDGLPFYSYKISKRTRVCHELNIRSDYDILTLVNDNQGKSEMCTLFLDDDYRHNANGLLLSRARFLFMAQFPKRFANEVIAEMRGVSDDMGHSPFWDNIGRHFFHMPFKDADRLTVSTNKQFIADLMPRSALYIPLLNPHAQAVIGQPHPSTVPAMNILLKEGFHFGHYVDIFDAGPTIEAYVKDIRTLRDSQTLVVHALSDEVSGAKYLVSNTTLQFKAVLTQCMVHTDKQRAILSKKAAKALGVTIGESIRIAPLKQPPPHHGLP